jgi:hypothetical protein
LSKPVPLFPFFYTKISLFSSFYSPSFLYVTQFAVIFLAFSFVLFILLHITSLYLNTKKEGIFPFSQFVNKLPFTNQKIKFSKRVFGQAFSKKLVEFEAKPQGFKVFPLQACF